MRIDERIVADYVLLNGKIYSMDDKDTIYTSMAVKGKRILFLGDESHVKQYIAARTQIINLHGKMVLPSFSDSHMHPPGTSILEEMGVDLSKAKGQSMIDAYLQEIIKYAKENPKLSTIFGYGWSGSEFGGKEAIHGPRKERLDQLNIQKPIVLYSTDYHTAWMNSIAFKQFGIDEYTGEDKGEFSNNIVKNTLEDTKKYGPLWGTLKEDAFILIKIPNVMMQTAVDAFLSFQQKMHHYGITSVASVYVSFMLGFLSSEVYKVLLEKRLLRLRIAYSQEINWHYSNSIIEQVQGLVSIRNELGTSPYFKVTAGKLFMDGVVDSRTAYLHEPYEQQDTYGYNIWKHKTIELAQTIHLLNSNGFQAHFHAIGDQAITCILDAMDENHYEKMEYRNLITHMQLIKIEDIPRLRKHQIIASLQVYWNYKMKEYWSCVEYNNIGERAEKEYPLQSLLDHQILVAGASDYPVCEPNPILAIQIGVTRNYCCGEGMDKIFSIDDARFLLNKQERASLKDMIKAYTKVAAYANFMDQEIGTLECNKYADFIVLSEDLYAVNPLELHKVKVVMTFFDGKLVYEY